MHNWIDRSGISALMVCLFMLGGCSMSAGRKAVTATGDDALYPPEVVDAYAHALGLMDAGKMNKARTELTKLANAHPDLAGPLTNLAILARQDGDTEAAVKWLNKATQVCTHCAPSWTELGIIQRRAGNFDAAEKAYLKALESDPDYAPAHYNLGVLYDLYQQRHEPALEHYERYVALSDDADSNKQVGKWIADLRRRLGEGPRTARAGEL
ncbi:MAG TPA: tetratricopeptide repeat protein [Chromatiales bacterium]|nr:tetratricopeptide repeat protein [Chromatiales bacterium]